MNIKSLLLLLFSRTFLFAFFQVIVALLLSSWSQSERYWMLTATLTNIVSIFFLYTLFRKEKADYLSIFRFRKDFWKKDLLLFSGLAILSVLVVLVILFRGLSYLPFALLLGIVLHKRPSLLPHFAILHVVLDGSAALMLLHNS